MRMFLVLNHYKSPKTFAKFHPTLVKPTTNKSVMSSGKIDMGLKIENILTFLNLIIWYGRFICDENSHTPLLISHYFLIKLNLRIRRMYVQRLLKAKEE